MRSIHLEITYDEPLLDQIQAGMGEEEFISTAKAILCLLARAEPEYLEYLRPKLLPHRLSFDRGSERPSHPAMVDVQPSATFLPTGSSQLETDKDSNLFETTLGDRHSSHSTASNDADMLDGYGKDKSDTSQAMPPKLLSHPAHVDARLGSASSLPPAEYFQAFNQLKSQDRDNSKYGLKQIIKLGDSFLRRDAISFIHSLHYRCGQNGLWYRPSLGNPMTGSLVERTLRSLRCAETTEEDTIVGPVRLRMARIFLYHYMEQKALNIRTNRKMPNLRSQGKDVQSIVIDLTLDYIYGRNNEAESLSVRKQRRESLKTHKGIGKRWSFLAAHLGIGILLTCDPSLESYINDKHFTENMIVALITYIVNVYPQGIQMNRMVEPLVESIMEGASSTSWPGAEVVDVVDRYKQQEEKECYCMKDKWQFVDGPKGFVRVLSV